MNRVDSNIALNVVETDSALNIGKSSIPMPVVDNVEPDCTVDQQVNGKMDISESTGR